MIPQLDEDVAVAEMDIGRLDDRVDGTPSRFSCPDCHGVLRGISGGISEGEMARCHCRVGHAYSPHSLLALQLENLEEALWVALRALEESAALAGRLQSRTAERGHTLSAQQFESQATDARHRAKIIYDEKPNQSGIFRKSKRSS